MINRKFNLIFILSLMLFPLLTEGVNAYNDVDGLETGDVVEVEFDAKIMGGSRDGEIAIPIETSILELTPAAMISGLYETLLGMRIDEIKNNVLIPSKKAFTETSHDLYNQTLRYNIHVLQLIHNNNFSSRSSQDSYDGLFDNIIYYTFIILVIFAISYLLILIRQSMRKYTQVMCSYCKNTAEGKCGRCGMMSCRASFSGGCSNCQSNTFVAFRTVKKR